MEKVVIFILCIVISFLLPTFLGASYKEYEKKWYKNLKRPGFAFPDIVFIIIFPIFYLLEAVGLFSIVVSQNNISVFVLAGFYLLSAILSGIWSRLFFIYKRCDLSLIAFFLELPVSWVLLFMLYQQDHIAWIFFLPRVVWGLYAIFVNIAYYKLNLNFWNAQKNSA